MDTEKRTLGTVEVREAEGKPEITMRVPYESWSEVLGYFKEKIQRGFFDGVCSADVRVLWNHDDSIVLGRSTNGTVRFEEDERGLTITARPPDTQAARDALTMIRGGFVTGTSFSFRAKEDSWNYDAEPMERTLIKGKTFEFSPVTFPAYPESSAATRAAYDAAVERRNQQPKAEPETGTAPNPEEGEAARAELELTRLRVEVEAES